MQQLRLIDFGNMPKELEEVLNKYRQMGLTYTSMIKYLSDSGWYMSQKQWNCYVGLFKEQIRLDLMGIDYDELRKFIPEQENKE